MTKKKIKIHKSQHSKKHHKTKTSKGAINAGFLYAILAILIIMAAASSLIGDISPQPHAPDPSTRQPATIVSGVIEPEKSNLQLYTFPAITITATPTAVPSYPADDNSSWKNKKSEGDDWNSGDGDDNSGGHDEPGGNSPDSGGSGGGDGGGSGSGGGSGEGGGGSGSAG